MHHCVYVCVCARMLRAQAANMGSKTLEDVRRNNMQIARMTDSLQEVRDHPIPKNDMRERESGRACVLASW